MKFSFDIAMMVIVVLAIVGWIAIDFFGFKEGE